MQYVPGRGKTLAGTPRERMEEAAADSSSAISTRRKNMSSPADHEGKLDSALCICMVSKRGGGEVCFICGGVTNSPADRAGTVSSFKVGSRQLGKPPDEATGVGGGSASSSAGPSSSRAGPSRSSYHEVGSPNTQALKKVMTTMTSAQRKQALASWQAQLDAATSIEESLSTFPPRTLLTSEAELAILLMGKSSRDELRERSARLVPIIEGNNVADGGRYFESALLAVSIIVFIDNMPPPPQLAAVPSPVQRGFNRDPEHCTTYEMFEDILGSGLAFSTDTNDVCGKWLADEGLASATNMIAFLQLEPTGRARADALAPILSTGDASRVVASLARFLT